MIVSKRPDVERLLKAPDAALRAVVIHGRDRAMVRERADALARKIVPRIDDPFDVSVLSDTETEALDEALSAQSLTGGRRLVRLRLGDKAGPDKAAAEALNRHLAGDFNPEAFLLIEADALGRESALRKAAEKAPQAAAAIPCYDDEPGDVARLARETLAGDRVGLDAEALELFVSRLPRDRGVARQEIERLALWLGPGSGRTASAADLIDFIGVEPEASLAEAAIDAFGARLGSAQAGLRRAAAEGEGGPAAVRAMGFHLARLRRALTLAANGVGLQEAAKAAGVFWKAEREFLRQARAWSLTELDAIQPQVLAADKACKSAGAPDNLIAERLALSIAGKARRLGL
ncbi:MAG: DNA polymerase III subunit delta [Caulobacterales bacterium 68-7]|nr:DNA polymerase III subunit delta [Caulobacterales bacterium]OJU07988.1 MAG: DNA polymerase III subunit delta [Caulobacterales bacterium 68-7]